MNFHKSQLIWGKDLVEEYPLVFLEADMYNVPWAKQAGVAEGDYCNLRYGFECNEGWRKHIETIAKKATEIVEYLRASGLPPEKAYIHSSIVKEKLGGLRWQGEEALPPLFGDLWRCYYGREESQSYGTCEITGGYGRLRETKSGERAWVKTLCTEKAVEFGYDLEDWEQEMLSKKNASAEIQKT